MAGGRSRKKLGPTAEAFVFAGGIPFLVTALFVGAAYLTNGFGSIPAAESMVEESLESAVVQLDSTEEFSYSRLAVEAHTAPGVAEAVGLTVYAAHGNPPTIGNYCVLAVYGDTARHYDSSTGQYAAGAADEEFACAADTEEWR